MTVCEYHPPTSGKPDQMNSSAHSDHPPTTVDHRAVLAAQVARFVTVVTDARPATPVPSCPGWTLVDLVRHTGSVHRWFSVLLHRRVQEPPTSREVDLRLPAGDEDYPAWLAASAAVSADALARTDPDAPMWAWGADQHARFWTRRMLFETLIHRVDAELALGIRPVIDQALAADGLDEFLVNLPFAAFFAPKVAELRGDGETIRLQATDGRDDWLVRLRPDGFEAVNGATPSPVPASATVTGTSADLLLLAYGRLTHDAEVFATSGDRDLLTRWAVGSAF